MFSKISLPAAGIVAGIILSGQAMAAQTSSLHGTVVRASDQAPLDGAVVNVYRASSTQSAATATTDSRGTFIIVDLAPGSYDLQVSRDAYRTVIIRGFKLNSGGQRFKDPIAMQAATDSVTTSQLLGCASLVQPGQTANVYVVCNTPIQAK
jgi:hypothetical protein